MRIATILLASILLVCPAQADDAILYRQIRFGSALTAGRMSACSMRFSIGFHDPSAPPRRDDNIDGELAFSRRDGHLSVIMTMRAFGDYTTKFTGVGQIGEVTLSNDGQSLRLEQQIPGVEPTHDALPSDRVSDLLIMLDGFSTLSFTLSRLSRRFAFPFSLTDEGLGADGDLASAGRAIFDDCIAALTRVPG